MEYQICETGDFPYKRVITAICVLKQQASSHVEEYIYSVKNALRGEIKTSTLFFSCRFLHSMVENFLLYFGDGEKLPLIRIFFLVFPSFMC